MVHSGMDGFDDQLVMLRTTVIDALERLERATSSQLEDSPMAHRSSTMLGAGVDIHPKIVGLFPFGRSLPVELHEYL